MRNYSNILNNIQEEGLTDTDIFNRSGETKNAEPAEAIATLKAIRIYKRNRSFAGYVREYLDGHH